jgi:ABC-type dipeptide/oligopeptide/nickel transport system permease component
MVTAMLIAIMGSVVNLLVDIACVFLDPRSKRQYKRQQ